MTIDRAIGLLKMAVPMRAVTMSEFNDFIEAVKMAIDALENLPSAEPRKKGHWIEKEPTIKELHGCYYECSKCHKFSLPFQKLNFCPNCGADMRGE